MQSSCTRRPEIKNALPESAEQQLRPADRSFRKHVLGTCPLPGTVLGAGGGIEEVRFPDCKEFGFQWEKQLPTNHCHLECDPGSDGVRGGTAGGTHSAGGSPRTHRARQSRPSAAAPSVSEGEETAGGHLTHVTARPVSFCSPGVSRWHQESHAGPSSSWDEAEPQPGPSSPAHTS